MDERQIKSPEGRAPFARHWSLDPQVDYLNHGSFGACPRAVLELQTALREEMEREPVDFLSRRLPSLLAEARGRLAAFVNADPAGLAFVVNATSGVNAVVRSLDLSPGDEILTTDHAYPACRKALAYAAQRSGARVVTAALPFPVRSDDEIVEAVLTGAGPRTRLALIDHVTSPTALVLPVGRIVDALAARGVETLVDGAHAPGMVPIDVKALAPAYYAANAHKWLCAPKGAAFLYVAEARRSAIHPTVISQGFDPGIGQARLLEEFDWTGTFDPTAWLCVPESIRHLGGFLPGGWPEIMARNHEMALTARRTVASALGVDPPCPDRMIGAMAALILPASAPDSPAARLDPEALARWLRERGIEGWFHASPGSPATLTRLSAQLYNDPSQYERLAAALVESLRG